MRRFRFMFDISNSCITISHPYGEGIGRLEYELPSRNGLVRLVLGDHRESIADRMIHRRLLAHVDTTETDIDKAEELASQVLEGVLSMLSLQSNASSGQPCLLLGWEITPGIETVEFLQIDYKIGELFRRKRAIGHEELQDDIQAILASNPKAQSRLNRALHWYRKGLSEGDLLDQFMSFWVGLEALNPLLEERFEVGKDDTRCPECNKLLQVRSSLGIRALFEQQSPAKLNDFDICRSLRSEIEHSYKSLTQVYSTCQEQEATELVRNMLRTGILSVVDLPVREGDKAIYDSHRAWVEYRIKFQTTPEALPEVPILDTSKTRYTASLEGDVLNIQVGWKIESNVDAPYTHQLVVVTPKGFTVKVQNEQG